MTPHLTPHISRYRYVMGLLYPKGFGGGVDGKPEIRAWALAMLPK